MKEFTPTHKITVGTQETLVRLHSITPTHYTWTCGYAYTEDEWCKNLPADYHKSMHGTWLYQGRPFHGTVEEIN